MVPRAQSTCFWLNKRPCILFGACNTSTHPGNQQELFFSLKSHFSFIHCGTARLNNSPCQEKTRWPQHSHKREASSPNIHIRSGLNADKLTQEDPRSFPPLLPSPWHCPSPEPHPGEQQCLVTGHFTPSPAHFPAWGSAGGQQRSFTAPVSHQGGATNGTRRDYCRVQG